MTISSAYSASYLPRADLHEPVVQFLAFLAQVAAGEALGEDADLVLDDLGRAAQRAQAAGDAVERHVRHRRDVAAHGRLDVVHHRQLLRTGLAAGAAGDAAEGDGIDLLDRVHVRLQLLQVVDRLSPSARKGSA